MEKLLKVLNTICFIIISLSLLYIALNIPDVLDRLENIAQFIANQP